MIIMSTFNLAIQIVGPCRHLFKKQKTIDYSRFRIREYHVIPLQIITGLIGLFSALVLFIIAIKSINCCSKHQSNISCCNNYRENNKET